MQFHHIWTIYSDLLSGHYVPSVNVGNSKPKDAEADWTLPAEMGPTVMFILYSFFFSLIEDSDDGLDAFRIWRLKFPDKDLVITALEQQIAPIRTDLRYFRNRLGFHGSRSQKHELRGFDLFGNQSGMKMLEAMSVFKALNAALIVKDLAKQRNSAEEMATARLLIDRIPQRCQALAGM
jgi:hypothetical protein